MGKDTDATRSVVIPITSSSTKTEKSEVKHHLGVAGFLSDGAAKREYLMLSRVRFQAYATDSLLMASDALKATPDELREIILNAATGMKDRYDIDSFTVVTPGLELVSTEELAELGLQSINLSTAITTECVRQELKHVGLLGTAWDTAEDGPLATALKKRRVKSYAPPETTMRQMLLFCVQLGMLSGICYEQKTYQANEFCLKAVDSICQSTSNLDGLVICNPELRWLAKDIMSCHPNLKIVDATQIHWDAMRKFVTGA